MNALLFLSIFSVLGVAYFILGALASKNIKTVDDYFLAGRDLGLASVTFTLIATQLGGGMLLGTAKESYSYGFYGILYNLGMSIGFLMLGCGFAAKLQSLKVATTAELFETKYKSVALKKVASLLSIVTLCGLLVSQIVGSKMLIAALGIDNELVFLAFWGFVIAYTMVGGLTAVVYTDIFQVLMIIAIFSGIFLYAIAGESLSFFSFPSLALHQTAFAIKEITIPMMLGTLLMPALYSLIEQDLAQRFFAARTKRIAAISALCSSAFILAFSCVPIYFGMKARLLNLVIPEGSDPLMAVLGTFANDLVLALAACAIIAAITSTADSLLCAVGSNVVQDFDFPIKEKNRLKFSQVVTLVIGVAALISSYLVPQNIIGIIIGSYEISVSCLFVPLIFCYFKRNVKKNAAIGSILFGLAGFIVFKLYPTELPEELLTLALSLLGYGIGSQFK